jgi:(p)ppGpp synthase/HD superfamily hydrolase
MANPSSLPGLREGDLIRIAAVWSAPDAKLRALIEAGGLDPKIDFRGVDFRGWPLQGQDVRGIDFTGSDLRGTGIEHAIRDETTILHGAKLDKVVTQQFESLASEARGFIEQIPKGKALKFKVPGKGKDDAFPIRGINTDLPVSFAPNGGAVPGDRIVGILTPEVGITIYPIQSPALKEFEDAPERWLDVRWDVDEEAPPHRFPARIALQSVNEPGSLAQIAQVIADHDGNIDDIRMSRQSPDFTSVTIDLEVYDLKHLTAIIAQLRAKRVVAKAERVIA